MGATLDNLQSQTWPGVTTYSYDPASNLTGYLYPNTVQTGYTYDTLNRLTNMQSTCGTAAGCPAVNTPLASFAYTLGAAGNRKNVTELGGRNVGYGYDNDYRLTSETITGDTSQNGATSYTYDAGGNRTLRNSTVPAIPATGTLTYDANDRSSTDPYDANGNLIPPQTTTNPWDFENRLIQDGAVSIVYDGDGNRVQETFGGVTTSYLVDTQNPTGYAQIVDELLNGSVTRTYAYGLQRISENQLVSGVWTASFYGYDGHGSVRFLTNSASSVTDTYEYDAFGNLLSSTGSTPNSYLFSGEQLDPALGMYQMRARWYRQGAGRFMSRDPLEGVLCCGLSWNPYIYVKQNPVNTIDPTGRGGLTEYEEGSMGTYDELEAAAGKYGRKGLENHHLIPQSLNCLLTVSAGKMLAIAILPAAHDFYDQQWNDWWGELFGYNTPRDCAAQLVTLEEVFAEAYVIYAGEPDIIAAITAWEVAVVVQEANGDL